VLEDNRQQKSEQVKNEREEERDITLEQQRLHNLQRLQNAAQYPVQYYKDVINYESVNYKSLGPYNVI
jgi:hypothetical protein